MDQETFKQFHSEGLISNESYAKVVQHQQYSLFSIHWELKTLLYLGILILTSGLGILVYKNLNSIGHGIVLLFIALVSVACFAYCYKNKNPFTFEKVKSPTPFFDYILLLGALCILLFIGYLQYQYHVFGLHYGMATFIPMVLLFYIAYNFDHLGILNMAIINLGVWLGVTATLKQLLAYDTFNSESMIYTYLGFGLLLIAFAWLTENYRIKSHFKFSYLHYGIHISFIALLAGYFRNYDTVFSFLWLIVLFTIAWLLFKNVFKQGSFYFVLVIILYSYIAVSGLAMRVLIKTNDIGGIYLLFIYFILSAIGLVYLLKDLNKKLKAA